MPSRWASSTSMASPVSMSSLVRRGPNSQGWAKYSTPHIPSRVPTTSAKYTLSAATMRSHAHMSMSPAAYTVPCTWAMVILRRLRHRRVLLEVVVPLLEHPLLGAHPGAAVDGDRVVLIGPGCPLGGGLLGAHVVARGEERADPAQDHDPHLVVRLGPEEGVVQLDQQAPVLGVAGRGRLSRIRTMAPSSSSS